MKRLFVLLPILLLLSCSTPSDDREGAIPIILEAGNQEIQLYVEVADDPDGHRVGLMNRTELSADQGMLFVFEQPQILSFWMKDTLIPLDILFFDEEGNFLNTQTMDPCAADPCPTYSSNGLALFALELVSEFFAQRLQPLLSRKGTVLRLRFAGE